MLVQGTKIFVALGEHGFFFFQVKMFTGKLSVLLTSILSFQKMYGLWGYLLKAKALAPINARRLLEGG